MIKKNQRSSRIKCKKQIFDYERDMTHTASTINLEGWCLLKWNPNLLMFRVEKLIHTQVSIFIFTDTSESEAVLCLTPVDAAYFSTEILFRLKKRR